MGRCKFLSSTLSVHQDVKHVSLWTVTLAFQQFPVHGRFELWWFLNWSSLCVCLVVLTTLSLLVHLMCCPVSAPVEIYSPPFCFMFLLNFLFFWLFHQPKQSLAFFNLICLTIHLCPLSRFLTDGERVCNLTLNPAYKKYAFYDHLWYENICISNVISTFHFVNIKVTVDILSLPQYLEICESSYCLSFLKKKLTSISQRLSLKFLGSVQSVHAYAYICGMMIWKENHNTTCEYLQYLY